MSLMSPTNFSFWKSLLNLGLSYALQRAPLHHSLLNRLQMTITKAPSSKAERQLWNFMLTKVFPSPLMYTRRNTLTPLTKRSKNTKENALRSNVHQGLALVFSKEQITTNSWCNCVPLIKEENKPHYQWGTKAAETCSNEHNMGPFLYGFAHHRYRRRSS